MDGCSCTQDQQLVELDYQEDSYMQVHVVGMDVEEGNSRTHAHTHTLAPALALALGEFPETPTLCLSQNNRLFCPFRCSTRKLGKNKALGDI
jgi:hypothetical protein